ncbi:hypothetical protein DWD10_08635 [Salmonella enterica]|uniref:Uncharacterized protein n=1 Tax=Salmonella enterica TaxID=28901 RepID=A0A5V3WMZ1_SALER|nr:hypothetical protein [Salmonella enterica]EDD5837196.1 hypothetical protein [Salmonella enterica subsp. enterica serovar Enteritidis]EBN4402003.1 hypothetical protein [Salmonella enterica]EBU0747156.1 hypothetical protein [Salmonella enterica]EGC1080668.1 hypothetical protein [Salmonella enterica]
MVNKKSNITNDTIWVNNNMPPLEYCSLSRASKLLGCEVEDLWHWQDIGAIKFAVNLGEDILMRCSVFHPDDKECSLLSKDEQQKLKLYAFMLLGNNRRGFGFSSINNSVYISEAINFDVICSGVFCFERTINKLETNNWYKSAFLRIESCKYATVFIRGEISSREFQENELLITRSAIEDIYSAIRNGFYISCEDAVISPVRVTIYQSDMIASLLQMVGLSKNEVFNLSADALNKKLGQLAARKGIHVPQPDKATWSKWRDRFR